MTVISSWYARFNGSWMTEKYSAERARLSRSVFEKLSLPPTLFWISIFLHLITSGHLLNGVKKGLWPQDTSKQKFSRFSRLSDAVALLVSSHPHWWKDELLSYGSSGRGSIVQAKPWAGRRSFFVSTPRVFHLLDNISSKVFKPLYMVCDSEYSRYITCRNYFINDLKYITVQIDNWVYVPNSTTSGCLLRIQLDNMISFESISLFL